MIPFAEQLTLRTDQIRYRRDHAKYLSLIASLALLHQYQRKRVTHRSESRVVATLDDARVANRLAWAERSKRRRAQPASAAREAGDR